MKKQDFAWLLGLTGLAGWIWARNLTWVSSLDQTLPILAGFVLFIWLPRPWVFGSVRKGAVRPFCLTALAIGLVGVLVDSTTVLAGAWVLLLWSWLSVRIPRDQIGPVRKLLVLPFLAFPWLTNDFARLSWYLRLSAAQATETLLRWSHFQVVRQGTFLSVNGFALSVEPACSGLNGLQALLTAGSVLAYLRLKRTALFWPALLLLPAAAWVANLMRILFAAALGSQLSPAQAERWIGPLHLAAGWFALLMMFGLCGALFSWAARRAELIERWGRRTWAGLPALEFTLIGYAGWECRGLLESWRHAPFERLGWLAFALWLLPAVLRRPAAAGGPQRWKVRIPTLAAFGLIAVAAGQLGDFNLLRQAGLAAVLAAAAPVRWRFVWMAEAVAWISALGWVGGDLGASPAMVAALRVALAAGAFATEWTFSRNRRPDLPLAYARIK